MQYDDKTKSAGKSAKQLLLGRLLLGGVTAAMLATSSLAAHATNINLAVASNFYGTGALNGSAIADIISAFQTANSGYTVTVSDNGATTALASHIVTGNTRAVDLFLAADVVTPWQLYNGTFVLASTITTPAVALPWVTGAPFDYALGYLAMLSNGAYDVSCGSGSCGYDPSAGYTSVAIATPTQAPYGQATKELLWNAYGIDLASPGVTVNYYANITGPLNAVTQGTDPVGFVALSAICKYDATATIQTGGTYPTGPGITTSYSAAAFNPNDVGASPIVNSHKPIGQGAIRISVGTARTAQQNTELEAFVAFIQDYTIQTSSSTADSTMMAVLKKYCYSAPHQ